MRPWTALIVAICSSTACSLVVSTNGLSGGPVDGSTEGDAGSNASNDGSVAADAKRIGEGGSTFFPPDAAASPCSTPHLFCDDFDTGDPAALATRWSSVLQMAGPLSLDTNLVASPPRALHLAAQPGTGKRASELRKIVATTTSVVHVELDMFSSGPGAGTWAEIDPVEVTMNPAPAGFDYHSVSLGTYPDGINFEYYKSSGGTTAPGVTSKITLPFGKWVHLAVTIDYAASPHTAVLAVDGVTAAQLTIEGTPPSSVEVALGATYSEKLAVDWTLGFDNVVVE